VIHVVRCSTRFRKDWKATRSRSVGETISLSTDTVRQVQDERTETSDAAS
jgi:hypothetical protein